MHQHDVPLCGDYLDSLSADELVELAFVQARKRMMEIARGDAFISSLVPADVYERALIERAK